jgi:EthD domain
MATDYAARDREATVTFYVPLWKRNGIPLELFDDYWRDVHGPVCARLPGQFQYWQWHVAHSEGGIFPEESGVSYRCDDEEQFDGIAELTFRSPEDRQAWFTASAILMDDEHNLFRKAIGYVTEPGNSRTYADRIEDGAPNGSQGVLKYHVMLKMAGQADDKAAVGGFRRYLTDTLAAAWTRSDHVAKFRLHLFEPPDVSRPPAAGVVHADPPERLCQAAFEIAFRSGVERELFFASQDYRSAVAGLSQYVRQVIPFPERNGYTFVYDGRMALAGRRGSRTASLITTIGATNQLRDNIAQLLGIREPNA